MNAKPTPDSPVQDAADAPAAEEPSWIEIGTPKRRNAPPAWSDEAAQNAWSGSVTPRDATGGTDQESQETPPVRIELVEAPDSADAAPQESDEGALSTPVDDWVQGPMPAEGAQSPAPADLEDPESGDRWHVVADDESPRPEDEAAAAPKETEAPAAQAVVEDATDEPVGEAHTDQPVVEGAVDPAAQTADAQAHPPSATLSGALDLVGPHLPPRRRALILGLVTLVLSTWMLVALPFPLKFSIDAALAVAGAETTAPDGIGADPARALLIAAGALAGLVALQAGLRALSVAVLNRAGGRIATALRGRLLSHLQHLSPGRDIDDLGHTASPLIEDVARLRDLVAHTGPRLLGGLLALASLLVVVLVVEPIAAAIVLVTAGLFALVAGVALRRQRRLETAAAADEAVLAETADELLAATATIQSYGLEQRAERSLGALGTRAARSRSAARRTRAVGRFLAELIGGLGVGAALLVGGWRMNSGAMTPGELTMVIAYVLLAVVLVRDIVQHAVRLPSVRAAAGRVGALLEHRAAITDPHRAQRIGRLRGEVVYSALSAAGPHGALFDRISLVIPAGQHMALVGREGREASALLSYLLRFEQPDTGRVLLDRFDTRVLALADLRRQLAVVQRESALFTETVRENIRVGRPEASDDEIVEAARRSGADEFITLLPEGYDTLLTRRGAGLSDGQRRRIAITRALLRDAPVVVLDGADEDLAPTERADVHHALEVLTEGRTALISSREAETVLAADRVVCFESGDLAEDGAPGRLAEDPDSWLASWLHAADVATR